VKRKLILYPLICLVVLGVGLFGVWYWIGMAGTSSLERWIGGQVKSIAGSYLNPRVEFDDLDYQKPYTVVLMKFRLTVDDPDNSGRTVDVIHVDKLRLELAEIPQEGKPIRIKKLILDHPKINAIAAQSDGKFMGFQNMLKERKEEVGAEPAQEEAPRLSDVFQIALLQIIEGRMVYESRGSGRPPMILDAINSRMDVEKDDQGWYKLAATLERKPVFGLKAAGRLDLDHLVLALDSLKLGIELGEQQYGKLPGQTQQMLREHEVTGMLQVTASGLVPLGDPVSSDLTATLSMEKAHFVAGEYKGEAQNVSGKLRLKDRRVLLEYLVADTLKGKVHLTADIGLVDPFEGRVDLTARGILIEETLRAASGGGQGDGKLKYKGAMDAEVTLTGPMDKILTRSGGGGWLKLRNGRLVSLRVIDDIGRALAQNIRSIFSSEKQSRQDTDAADLEFRFMGDRVHFTNILAQTSTFAVRGHGDIWFDKRLSLLLNGGSPEDLQSVTDESGRGGNEVVNAIGDVLNTIGRGAEDIAGGVLSHVATVVVSGTTDEPAVRVEPFRKVRDMLDGK